MTYKYSIGQKVMGRHVWYGAITFIAGEIVEQFEGIGRSYVIKLEPGITIPEGLRNDGLFPITERNAVQFDELRWEKIKSLANTRNDHLQAAHVLYEQIMAILS